MTTSRRFAASRRTVVAIICTTALTACSLAPQLGPRAVGCYAVQIDTLPDVYRRMLVPQPPAMVRLDSIHGGQLQVPEAWAGQTGPYAARLQLMRPGFRIEGSRVQLQSVGPGVLPPDSIVLNFGALTAPLAQDPSGDWTGWAFALTSATPYGEPILPMRLQRRDCGTERFGITG